jgi:hypothetical protein
MSALVIILVCILALLLILFIAGGSKPRIMQLEESEMINRPLTDVWPEVSSLRSFVTWSPWSDKDPSMKQEFSGPDGEVGSVYTWSGNRSVGSGKMEITVIEPASLVVLSLNFGNRGNARSAFVLQDLGDSTKVTWSFGSDMGNPLMRGLMSGMIARFIRKDYSQGLANLKNKLENR